MNHHIDTFEKKTFVYSVRKILKLPGDSLKLITHPTGPTSAAEDTKPYKGKSPLFRPIPLKAKFYGSNEDCRRK